VSHVSETIKECTERIGAPVESMTTTSTTFTPNLVTIDARNVPSAATGTVTPFTCTSVVAGEFITVPVNSTTEPGGASTCVLAMVDSMTTRGRATHTPLSHDAGEHDAPEQAAASHGVPSGAGVDVHPTVESHASTVHGFESSQLTAVVEQPPVVGSQKPARQRSATEQSAAAFVHDRFEQRSTVQRSPSSQAPSLRQQPAMAVPAHCPPEHVSAAVQSFPSTQGVPSAGRYSQPTDGLHESAVHALPSSQVAGVCWQAPSAPQASDVQRFPSSHVLGEHGEGHAPTRSPCFRCAGMAEAATDMV
jgi:hypothetical protein